MDEGRTIANDKARYKHAIVNASWDIKPKELPMSLRTDNTSFRQSWFCSINQRNGCNSVFLDENGDSQEATLFSNGRGEKK
jgi:hypothetical protein